jgi:hypothetical protein
MSTHPPTPIPLGSPHVRRPPMFEQLGSPWGGTDRGEQRAYTRRPIVCDVWLIDAGWRSVVRCKTENVSDAGLCGKSPIGYGLAVGQRYEVRIVDTQAAGQVSPDLAPSLGYATVVRTQLDVDGQGSHGIGFALRYDVPQLLPI